MPDRVALERYESSAERGIIEFAEAMQAIRDQKLYPGAENDSQTVKAAWKSYCQERWGMGKSSVNRTIQALPVLKQLATRAAGRQLPSIEAAATVATLPEPVQDAILDGSTCDEVKAKAKAVRQLVKRVALTENRTPTVEEQIAEAAAVKPPPKKPKRKVEKGESKFISACSNAHSYIKGAADVAQAGGLDETENAYGFNWIQSVEYELGRIKEAVYRPAGFRDRDADFARLLEQPQP